MSFFIDVENAIAERLRQSLMDIQPTPKVYQGRDLAGIKDRSQGDLSVFVAYNGIINIEQAAPTTPHIGTITHEYLVWVVAKSAKQHAGQVGTREIADPVLEKIVCLLMGCRVCKGTEPLRIAPSAMSPAYSDNGFGYFPLTFHQRKQVRDGA